MQGKEKKIWNRDWNIEDRMDKSNTFLIEVPEVENNGLKKDTIWRDNIDHFP